MEPSSPLDLQFSASAAYYRPGETLTALLLASAPDATHNGAELQEVEVSFSGIERVDTSWVSTSYRQSVPAINQDKRRLQRHVVHSRLRAATQGSFADAPQRRFIVRFSLPSWLPPTYKGTAVRYWYSLEATVKFRRVDGVDEGGQGGVRGPLESATARLAVHVLPSRDTPQQQQQQQQQQQPPALGRTGSGSGNLAAAVVVAEGDVFPSTSTQALSIKCWEIGPGTSVLDAIGHIETVGSATPLQRGNSLGTPARMGALLGQGSSGALAVGSSLAAGDDAEISHSEFSSPVPSASAAASGRGRPSTLAVPPPPAARRLISGELSVLPSPGAGPAEGSGNTLRSFALRVGVHPLVRINLHPAPEGALCPGATLLGTLDFVQPPAPSAADEDDKDPVVASTAAAVPSPGSSAANPRCVQVLVLLETEETVEAQWRPSGRNASDAISIRRVHDEHFEVTADVASTHFVLTLPPEGPLSLRTPAAVVRWVLRFEFTASASKQGTKDRGAPPLAGTLSTLTWTMPLTVVPPV